ncbi:unnamed protein product [Cyberlindnera jadinii]|uniref:HCP-like protein n=1 Tax=Cyberlindnera jadinii (strain ATCC 18201 / CBS 1600 / BCRC 20928 / JCM 3617 / NBRC 0987 / NRRL Y-1542) TaxID=983966 RepID=A0A0H5CFG8_CYBJN|nr:unnamed protein product [Cyberlindnera jadinii]
MNSHQRVQMNHHAQPGYYAQQGNNAPPGQYGRSAPRHNHQPYQQSRPLHQQPVHQQAPSSGQRAYDGQSSNHVRAPYPEQSLQNGTPMAPYPVQPYPGFVNPQSVSNLSTDSIGHRIQNRDETQVDREVQQYSKHHPEVPDYPSLGNHGMGSSHSLLSVSSGDSKETYSSSSGGRQKQQPVPQPVQQPVPQPVQQPVPQREAYRQSTPAQYNRAPAPVPVQVPGQVPLQVPGQVPVQVPLHSSHPTDHSIPRDTTRSLEQLQRPQEPLPVQQEQARNAAKTDAPVSQRYEELPSQNQRPAQQPPIEKKSPERNIPQLTAQLEKVSVSDSQLQKLNDLRFKALSPAGSNDSQLQVEWVKLLLALASDKEFVSRYTLNGELIKSNPHHSEIKKNTHAFIKLAIKTLKTVCNEGQNAEALFILASLYSNIPTIAVPKPDLLDRNLDKAFVLYVKSGSLGYPLSLYRCGVSCEFGIGTHQDEERALDYYKRATDSGCNQAMFKMALIYADGLLGVRRSATKTVEWLQRAAAQADVDTPHSLFELCKVYSRDFSFMKNPTHPDIEFLRELDRIGVLQDDEKALYYCKEAARLVYPPAQCKLGWCYEYGKMGCTIDPKKSIGWYSRAAKNGNSEAEMALSGWYLTGAKGLLEANDREAFLWAFKSAESGFDKAEYALGYYYEVGLGCERDLEMARKFYQRAASQGHEKAVEKLRGMRDLR